MVRRVLEGLVQRMEERGLGSIGEAIGIEAGGERNPKTWHF
jgi:hypothetical protein